jgi:hypothetical protein
MSFDLNLETVCDHRIYKEPTTLASDRQSIRVGSPIASSGVEVFASDSVVPKTYYILILDPTQLVINQARMIYLKKKWKSVEDFWNISYVTLSNFCPKCVGFNTLNDISYDIRGNLLTIRNEPLLLQNLEKFTVTELQTNPFQVFIGTNLVKLIGQKISDPSYISSRVTQEITSTLQVLKDLQSQYTATGRSVTNGELLNSVDSVKVNFDENDPTILRADVTVTAKSGRSVSFSQFLQVA